MKEERIQKIIASSGLCSRRYAEELLTEGRVKVNGKLAILGESANQFQDRISVDEIPIKKVTIQRVFLLNKPAGIICTCNDPHGRETILSLLPKSIRKGIYPVGRLDLNSRGAIILTNIGTLALRLTHPRFNHIKNYYVWVKGQPSEQNLDKWRTGIMLDDIATKPANVQIIQSSSKVTKLKVILKEGRNRQIRRIAQYLGHPVLDLKRTSIAGISLKNLPEGKWRELREKEWLPILNKENLKLPITKTNR